MSQEPQRDLRKEVTVFVSTVGYPTFDACLDHLRKQDCQFQLEIIDHVAPMNAALQLMVDRCKTPYYVQVDEDMLLRPYAVRTLHERITALDSTAAFHAAPLYDVHACRQIWGVKIYRHAIVSRYPYRNMRGCEVDQIMRLRADGFRDDRAPQNQETPDGPGALGLHGTYWTPHAVYLRYSVLELKRRAGAKSLEWVRDSATALLERCLETQAEEDFFALMGLLAGTFSRGDTTGEEKNYTTYGNTPGFAKLSAFLEEVRNGWCEGEKAGPESLAMDVVQEATDGLDNAP